MDASVQVPLRCTVGLGSMDGPSLSSASTEQPGAMTVPGRQKACMSFTGGPVSSRVTLC